MELLRLLCLTFILCTCTAIDIDDIFLSNCPSGSNCDDPINTDFATTNFTGNMNTFNEDIDNDENTDPLTTENAINTNSTTQQTIDKTSPTTRIFTVGSTLSTIEATIDTNNEIHSDICACDLTVSMCDINCCCDADCNRFQLAGFSNNSYRQAKVYDSRYCYTKNFIYRNSTQFILERLASNLFCIAYDNLPPIYGIKESLDIRDEKSFQDATSAKNRKKYSWDWNKFDIPSKMNISSRYHRADGIWKFQNNKITLIELPQSGFTNECKFGKMLKYRESSKWKCMQTNLSNNNEYLFGKAYDNFTVVSPSHIYNLTYLIGQNHTCPVSVCVPVQSFYCSNSSSICNTTKSPEQSCIKGICQNVIKRVRYTIALNGTCGLRNIEIRYEITNASTSFYQYFEVTFQEANRTLGKKSFVPSESSGYTFGNPIITGTLVRSNINNVITEHINIGNSNFYLTLPMSQSNGDCHSRERYIVGFGEDIRLKCTVQFTTDQFSSRDSCVTLQNQIFDFFLGYLSHNMTQIDKFNTFVSKTGETWKKDTSNWTEILFDKVARNLVVTGQTYDNRIRCSGLLTSVNINILYTILPKLKNFDNHKIEGISVTFNEPFDISWLKCVEPKCIDVLKTELLSLVSFTDISTPSMYYYASGPNLDISLPYDFFYPFMNDASNAKPTTTYSYLIIRLVGGFIIFNFFKLI